MVVYILNLKFQTTLLPYSTVDASNIAFRPHVLLHFCEVAIRNLKISHPRARRLGQIKCVPGIFPC